MKEKGFMIATIRTYLGVQDGTDAWIFSKYIVGIKKGNNVIVDYQSGEEYNAIFRTIDGYLQEARDNIEIGNVYAVESLDRRIDKNCFYTDRQIKRFIRNTEIFSEEYRKIAKPKIMIKK